MLQGIPPSKLQLHSYLSFDLLSKFKTLTIIFFMICRPSSSWMAAPTALTSSRGILARWTGPCCTVASTRRVRRRRPQRRGPREPPSSRGPSSEPLFKTSWPSETRSRKSGKLRGNRPSGKTFHKLLFFVSFRRFRIFLSLYDVKWCHSFP